MKLITRDTDYAVRALCAIAGSGKDTLDVRELESRTGIPRPFLRKILQKLNKGNVLISYKGKGGGFELAKSPEDITVYELLGIFQGPVSFRECMFKKRICPRRRECVLRKKLEGIETKAAEAFKKITIKTLVRG